MWFWDLLLGIYCLKILIWFGLLLTRKVRPEKPLQQMENEILSVDVLLPMYNEERVVVKTIENLLNIDYPGCNIIVVDDGSSDDSYQVACQHFGDHPRVRIVRQNNAGKSAALNRAMNLSESDIIVCVDADTLVRADIMDIILPCFQDKKVAAVSGYIRVGNKVNLLTHMQFIEYITLQNFERSVFEDVNGILVVPGALGAFRREVVKSLDGFTSKALAEDCDITLRMLCANYVIKNAAEAISFTEAPDTVNMFFKQRVRWTVGLVQGLLRYAGQLTRHPNKALAFIVLPYTWCFRIVLPFLVPLADYFFLAGYFLLGNHELLPVYLICMAAETFITGFILVSEKQRFNPLQLIFMQKIFRHLVLFSYVCIFLRWTKGSLYKWNKIPRQGNVELD
ncbi:glycosyltransferase family 2 protein [Chitinophaga varians]|uniref:Glycosyltransferase family 2 protein n=1 Tax=Chitinophaga varians TaxID=2202339 RepID=A0A847RNT6_9BACT|nr:glycosyltransferase [Chitinophaga varians]NLR68639.1 glycosyltransferase family 2 protein [Chitinophaga varians]